MKPNRRIAKPPERTRSIAFRPAAPLASDVRITGDFTGWTLGGIPRWDKGDGSWRTLLSLEPACDRPVRARP